MPDPQSTQDAVANRSGSDQAKSEKKAATGSANDSIRNKDFYTKEELRTFVLAGAGTSDPSSIVVITDINKQKDEYAAALKTLACGKGHSCTAEVQSMIDYDVAAAVKYGTQNTTSSLANGRAGGFCVVDLNGFSGREAAAAALHGPPVTSTGQRRIGFMSTEPSNLDDHVMFVAYHEGAHCDEKLVGKDPRGEFLPDAKAALLLLRAAYLSGTRKQIEATREKVRQTAEGRKVSWTEWFSRYRTNHLAWERALDVPMEKVRDSTNAQIDDIAKGLSHWGDSFRP